MKYGDKKKGYSVALFSIFLNIILFSFKYWAGLKYNSVAVRADAWHTLSDVITSIIVILGLWISFVPADERHPFGHGRAEEVASIILATLLLVVGLNFIKESIFKLASHQSANFGFPVMIIFLVSAGVKEGMALLSLKMGRKMGSNALIADAWHHRSDALASILIFFGVVIGRKYWWVDGVMGMAVSLFIIYISYKILRDVISLIMGEEASENEKERIKDLALNVSPYIKDVHHIHVHRYGGHIELTFHIRLPPDMKLKEAHKIVKEIENRVMEEMGMETTVHVDPIKNESLDE